MLTDKELVEKATSGNLKAFNKIIQRYDNAIYGIAYHLLHDYHLAQDIAQEVFIKAYFNLSEIKNPEKIGSWLFSVTKRQCIDYIKKKKPIIKNRIKTNKYDNNSFEKNLLQKEETKKLWHIINTLSRKNKLTLILHYFGEYSTKEIAQFLNLSVRTVESRLYRTRKQLKKELVNMDDLNFEKTKLDAEFENDAMNKIRQINELLEESMPDWIEELYNQAEKNYKNNWINIFDSFPEKTKRDILTGTELIKEINEFNTEKQNKIKTAMFWMWLCSLIRSYKDTLPWSNDINKLWFWFGKRENKLVYTLANKQIKSGPETSFTNWSLEGEIHPWRKNIINEPEGIDWKGLIIPESNKELIDNHSQIDQLYKRIKSLLKTFSFNPDFLISEIRSQIKKRFEKVYMSLSEQQKKELQNNQRLSVTHMKSKYKEYLKEISQLHKLSMMTMKFSRLPVWITNFKESHLKFSVYRQKLLIKTGILNIENNKEKWIEGYQTSIKNIN